MHGFVGWVVAVGLVLSSATVWADVAGPPSPYHVCNALAEGDRCYEDLLPDCYCRPRPPEECTITHPDCLICRHLAADGGPEGELCDPPWDGEESDDDDDDERDGGCALRVGPPSTPKTLVLLALIAMIGYVTLRRDRQTGPPQDDDDV